MSHIKKWPTAKRVEPEQVRLSAMNRGVEGEVVVYLASTEEGKKGVCITFTCDDWDKLKTFVEST